MPTKLLDKNTLGHVYVTLGPFLSAAAVANKTAAPNPITRIFEFFAKRDLGFVIKNLKFSRTSCNYVYVCSSVCMHAHTFKVQTSFFFMHTYIH